MEDVRDRTTKYILEKTGNKKNASVIEQSIFDYLVSNIVGFDLSDPEHENEYKYKARSILHNLDHILPKLKDKTLGFKLKDIASQSKITLNPERWKTHIKRIELNRKRTNTKPQETTDQFRCGKCNDNKTTYYLRQTRSADEPETVFITCVSCGNKWRQNG